MDTYKADNLEAHHKSGYLTVDNPIVHYPDITLPLNRKYIPKVNNIYLTVYIKFSNGVIIAKTYSIEDRHVFHQLVIELWKLYNSVIKDPLVVNEYYIKHYSVSNIDRKAVVKSWFTSSSSYDKPLFIHGLKTAIKYIEKKFL